MAFRLLNRKLSKIKKAEKLFFSAIEALGKGDLAIDCGANVGEFTLPMAKTGADVIAYEPDEQIFDLLKDALKGHPNATLHQAAVSTTSGTTRLIRSPYFDVNPKRESLKSTILPEALTRDREGDLRGMDFENTLEVELVDLIALLQQETSARGHIALLKIDIEGAELNILERMEALDLFIDIAFTVVEMHGFRFPQTRDRIANIIGKISARYPANRVNFDWR